MSKESDSAVEYFNNGFNCAQAVLFSHSAKFGLDEQTALKISCAFGGGISYSNKTCGAVTGAIMLISLKYGKSSMEDNDAKDITFSLTRKFMQMFSEKHGSVNCTDLIGCDLSSEQKLLQARETGVFKTVCPILVKDAVEIVEKLI
ncbi:MAG: C_GCAxxG_C_C family protein [Spirochaetes bacterium]|nr:C_GCAxxG_C_C family protein [Spirochaetota bacterium]